MHPIAALVVLSVASQIGSAQAPPPPALRLPAAGDETGARTPEGLAAEPVAPLPTRGGGDRLRLFDYTSRGARLPDGPSSTIEPPVSDATVSDAPVSHAPVSFSPMSLPPMSLTPGKRATQARIDFQVGFGTFEHTTQGAPAVSDDTDAAYVRLGFDIVGEAGFGGGLHIEGTRSDDDLFADVGGLASEATDGELFLHGTGLLGDEDFSVPIRFGLMLRNYRVEENSTNIRFDWQTVGARVEAEPELKLIGSDDVRLSLIGRLGFGFGVTTIETDPASVEFDTTMYAFDAGFGGRLGLGPVDLELAYLFKLQHLDESDPVGITVVNEVETEFSGLLLGFAVGF